MPRVAPVITTRRMAVSLFAGDPPMYSTSDRTERNGLRFCDIARSSLKPHRTARPPAVLLDIEQQRQQPERIERAVGPEERRVRPTPRAADARRAAALVVSHGLQHDSENRLVGDDAAGISSGSGT